jgi:nucleoredoxin
MPWIALPFGSPQTELLKMMYSVRGIPSVVALNGSTGSILDSNARDAVARNRFDLAACCRDWGVAVTSPAPALAPAEPPKKAEPPRKPEPKALPIDDGAAKDTLRAVAEVEWSAQEVFYVTLLKVLNNVLQNPEEPKFRSLKKGNAALQTKLFGVADGAAAKLLVLGGFEDGEVIALPGPPDGRMTALRDCVSEFAETEHMRQKRKERDAKIAEEMQKDKDRPDAKKYGGADGDGSGRMNIGGDRRKKGGG